MTFRQLAPRPRLLSSLLVLLFSLTLASGDLSAAAEAEPVTANGPIFRFQTDSFWLNLHHFLYVLGRAEAEMSDSARRAVAAAPDDQERGLETVPPERRQLWRDAVSVYATGPSQLDSVFDDKLFTAVRNLVAAGDSLDGIEIEEAWAAALTQAAPIYRQTWWPEHRAANRAWVAEIEPLLQKHGRPVLDFITRAAGLPWPIDGFPIQVSGYSNWAGAYSTKGGLLVLSSLDQDLRGTTLGLEIAFHEAMHQWDTAHFEALVAAAKAQQVRFPGGLAHAMLFFTAGEAVRTIVPGHVPYAEKYGIWQRRSGQFLPMLEETWRPYLHGVISRDHALANLMRHFEKPTPD